MRLNRVKPVTLVDPTVNNLSIRAPLGLPLWILQEHAAAALFGARLFVSA
jgi:hypothetical protein